jgi:azurin
VRRQLILLPLLAAPLRLSACGRHSASAPGSGPAPEAAKTVELHIATDGDFLAFVPNELTCPTRTHVRLVFHHAGARVPQQHNWMLVKPGTLEEVDKAATAAGEANAWVPQNDPRVLAATMLCNPGGTVTVEFIAPAPGDYPFFCSFPGHGAEMRGVLHVIA